MPKLNKVIKYLKENKKPGSEKEWAQQRVDDATLSQSKLTLLSLSVKSRASFLSSNFIAYNLKLLPDARIYFTIENGHSVGIVIS